MKILRSVLLASALVLVSAASARAFPHLEPVCTCPENYQPVLCSDGVTYGNSCFAGCAGATGCAPTGQL